MNIYDYFMNASAASLRDDIIKGGWYGSYRDLDGHNEEFCKLMGLENDKRVRYYAMYSYDYKCEHVFVSIEIDAEQPIGKFSYDFEFHVSGYKKPSVVLYRCGNNNGEVRFDFGRKYYRPFAPQKDSYNLISAEWKNEYFTESFPEVTRTMKLHEVVEVVREEANKLNPIFADILDCFESGRFREVFDTCKKKYDNLFPAFWSMANLMYNVEKRCGLKITPVDATVLSLYYIDRYGHVGHAATDNAPKDETLAFVWNWSIFDKVDEVQSDADTIRLKISEARDALCASTDEFNEFSKARIAADDYVIEKLKPIVAEASEKFGINEEFIYLSRMTDKKRWLFAFEGDKAPINWRKK